jgi:hypothetical protein
LGNTYWGSTLKRSDIEWALKSGAVKRAGQCIERPPSYYSSEHGTTP